MKQILFFLGVFFMTSCVQSPLPKIDHTWEDITVMTNNNQLVVENSQIQRVWNLTDYGLVTESVTNTKTNKEWTSENSNEVCDWAYYGLVDKTTTGELINLTVEKDTDEGFTSEHLAVIAEFFYAQTQTSIKYVVWVYPNSKGIRTQSFIKSSGNKEDAKSAINDQDALRFELKAGKRTIDYSATAHTDLWYASVDTHDKSIEYRALNLDPDKEYMLGLSWWDYTKGGGTQQIRITSIDGENDQLVLKPTQVPDFKGKKAKPEELVVAVPMGVNMDGTVRIYIDNVNGKNATVSELWLMEKGGKDMSNMLKGEPDRIASINKTVQKGYALSAYYDCGTGQKSSLNKVTGHVDYLPTNTKSLHRYIGYYNDTQHRNRWDTPIYKELVVEKGQSTFESINWANALSVEDKNEGVIMLKESHKCVNQYGVDTGDFLWTKDGVKNTGTSLTANEISNEKYKWFWGSWIVVYDEGDAGRELALKQFDRSRFPVNKERDMYSVMCTWGHSKNPRDGRNYATEKEVLKEMDYVAKAGIDMILIDDGWQVSLKSKGANPDGGLGWRPHPENYPNAWINVVEKANELDLKVGLWGVAQRMPADDMIWNYNELGMRHLKLDFASFGSHDKLNNMMDTVRRFMVETDHQCHISWDLTENAARYGYYWAREYGNLHFMNRKPFLPANVLYVPSVSLRDFWLLSKYNNLNKYQLVIQNPEVVDHSSDAYKHSPQYCVATALMGIPEFMAVTRFYSEKALAEVNELMTVYKEHQEALFDSYVFPIGDQPTNGSFSGFQSCEEGKSTGYIMAFRELNNKATSHEYKLNFIKNKTLKVTNLMTGKTFDSKVGSNGELKITIDKAADFRFLKYEIL